MGTVETTPPSTTVERLQIQQTKVIRVLFGRHYLGGRRWSVGYANAHPRLSASPQWLGVTSSTDVLLTQILMTDLGLTDRFVRHLRRRIMERYPRFRRLRFAPPAVMHGLPSPMAHRCGRWAYGNTSYCLSQKARIPQKLVFGSHTDAMHVFCWCRKKNVYLQKGVFNARRRGKLTRNLQSIWI